MDMSNKNVLGKGLDALVENHKIIYKTPKGNYKS
jgi:hypothetical protein